MSSAEVVPKKTQSSTPGSSSAKESESQAQQNATPASYQPYPFMYPPMMPPMTPGYPTPMGTPYPTPYPSMSPFPSFMAPGQAGSFPGPQPPGTPRPPIAPLTPLPLQPEPPPPECPPGWDDKKSTKKRQSTGGGCSGAGCGANADPEPITLTTRDLSLASQVAAQLANKQQPAYKLVRREDPDTGQSTYKLLRVDVEETDEEVKKKKEGIFLSKAVMESNEVTIPSDRKPLKSIYRPTKNISLELPTPYNLPSEPGPVTLLEGETDEEGTRILPTTLSRLKRKCPLWCVVCFFVLIVILGLVLLYVFFPAQS